MRGTWACTMAPTAVSQPGGFQSGIFVSLLGGNGF